jgi:ADP-ribose pyrophosphatase
MTDRLERVSSELVWEGKIVSAYAERYRHPDGHEVSRDRIAHPGAVAVAAYDHQHVWLVRQPREVVGEPDLLEVPAGKMDEEGESAEATARRELAEEIGKAAGRWEHVHTCYSSPGSLDERIEIYLATELTDAAAESGEDERIDIVRWPLDRLDEALAECRDAKTLIALYALRRRLADGA